MIGYVFIQTNEIMLEGQEFICIFETIFAIDIEFKHPNFSMKGRTIHSILLLSFQYCYVAEICTNFLLVKMKGNINKEMADKMKRRESLKS